MRENDKPKYQIANGNDRPGKARNRRATAVSADTRASTAPSAATPTMSEVFQRRSRRGHEAASNRAQRRHARL